MKIIQTLVEQLTGSEMVNAFVEQMLERVDGFPDEHNRYQSAISRLKEELGDTMDDVVSAIHKRTAAVLFLAGFLGLKMNWDHFINPMAPNCTWSQVDYNDYLREDFARSLPEYRLADALLSDFYHSLTAAQQKTYDAITEYENHLLTAGPKLAHYYGYLLGNTLLYHLIPGYHPDTVLTIQYNTMLTDYFGKPFLPVVL